jgi:carbamoyl-phosphate synthase small subunit
MVSLDIKMWKRPSYPQDFGFNRLTIRRAASSGCRLTTSLQTPKRSDPIMAEPTSTRAPQGATGVLVLASGEVIWGRGFGAEGAAVGEVCFHTAMTGYQEIMTDPSFAGQIINFAFPHIGNVGTNTEDMEANTPYALGAIVRQDVTNPSNFRSTQHFDAWMKANGRIGISGVDTRALTRLIRDRGAPNGVIAHSASGQFDVAALFAQAQAWPGLEGMDLAKDVTTLQSYGWDDGLWALSKGSKSSSNGAKAPKVVAIDYGMKTNILRNLVDVGCEVQIVPASASFEDIMAHNPDGLFLSNGPGDPAATGAYAVPVIQQWPRPSDAGPRGRRENGEDASGAQGGEPPG